MYRCEFASTASVTIHCKILPRPLTNRTIRQNEEINLYYKDTEQSIIRNDFVSPAYNIICESVIH